jgi:L-lactate utilization protein LutC
LKGAKGSEIAAELEHSTTTAASDSSQELSDRFAHELEQVGGSVYRAASSAEAKSSILGILEKCEAGHVARANTTLVAELDLDEALRKSGIQVTVCDLELQSAGAIREAEFVADVGITSADYGVAESGTLALLANPGQGRAVSLLPPVHIAVLRSTDIVGDLAALFGRATAEHDGLPSALTFITGPSRTADIELVLTVGVHGPKEIHVIVLQ